MFINRNQKTVFTVFILLDYFHRLEKQSNQVIRNIEILQNCCESGSNAADWPPKCPGKQKLSEVFNHDIKVGSTLGPVHFNTGAMFTCCRLSYKDT